MKILIITVSILLSGQSFAAQTNATIPVDFNNSAFDCEKGDQGLDYRRNDAATLTMKRRVEGTHFTIGVQRGLYGNAGSLEGDLNYVLRKFPNHPNALLVAARNQMKSTYNPQRKGRKDRYWTKKECYFQNALRLAADDPNVHLVIAIFYHEFGNNQVAERHYQTTIKLSPNNPESHYNYALLLLDLNRTDEALKYAKQAYAMGYPLEGLKNRLKRQNAWKEG